MRPRTSRIILLVALLLAGVALSRTPRALGGVSGTATPLLRPLTAATIAVAAWLRGVGAALRDPQRVAALTAALAEETARADAFASELTTLRAAVANDVAAAARAGHAQRLPVAVIASASAGGARNLTVALPPGAAVPSGVPVLMRGALIGTIQDAGGARARVRLLTDAATRIGVRASTDSALLGLLQPTIGGGLIVAHIAADAVVPTGTAVVTAALDARVPEGIPIGRITALRTDPDGFFQTAVLEPLVHPLQSSAATILLP